MATTRTMTTAQNQDEDLPQLLSNIRDGDALYLQSWLQDYGWNGQEVLCPHGKFSKSYVDKHGPYGIIWQSKDGDDSVYAHCSLLHIAISANRVTCLQALLSYSNNNDSPTRNLEILSMGCGGQLQTPLAFACASGASLFTIRCLVHAGANVHVLTGESKATLLMMCAEHDDSAGTARFLLKHVSKNSNNGNPNDFVNQQDIQGRTALVMSIDSGADDVMRVLLYYGASPNIPTHEGHTALHMEFHISNVFGPDLANVQSLLRHGADLNARTQSGATPLLLFLQQPFSNDNIHPDVIDPDVLRALLEAGASLAVEDLHGNTPLICARARPAILRVLLEEQQQDGDIVSIDYPNSRGETALHAACQKRVFGSRNDEAAHLLHEFHANPHLREHAHGRTPLHYAVRAGNAVAMTVLLSDDCAKRCMTDTCTAYGRTPLHDLLWSCHAKRGSEPWLLEEYLIHASECGVLDAVLQARDLQHGWTPLHWAAFGGQAEAVRLLVQAGANVRATDNRGRTPLHLASLTLINAEEWREDLDIPHCILSAPEHPMSQQDWDDMRADNYRQHVSSFRGCGPPGGFYITHDVPKILLEEGLANPLTVDNDGNLPVFLAAVLLEDQPQLLDTVYLNIRAGAHVKLSNA